MKYQNLVSFQKQLASSAPNHLCRWYFVGVADDYERMNALNGVLSYLPERPSRFNGNDCELKDVIDAMQSMSLLGEPVILFDEVDKLNKKAMITFCEQLPMATGFVLLGAKGKAAALMELVEKEGIVLDLLGEKPWDREKRLSEQAMGRAKAAGKALSHDAAQFLLERVGADAALLSSEVDKLVCFAGDRAAITRDDILQMTVSATATLWETAEGVVWEGEAFPSMDSNAFHSLVPALRGQLHLGLTLATLIEERRPSEEWGKYLPKLWPKTLEKRSSQAGRIGSGYFKRGLDQLFEIELASRNSSSQYRALLDLFRAHLNVR